MIKPFLQFDIAKKQVMLVFATLCFTTIAYSQEPPIQQISGLTYYTEHYPPSNYMENNELKGMSVETIKLIWKVLGVPEQPIQVVPWARGYRIIQSQKNSVLFTMSRSVGREDMFKWVGPIFTAKHVLLARADFEHGIKTIEDAYQYPIAAIRNDISEIALIEAGFPKDNIAPLTNLEQSILMLANGRLDLIILSEASIKGLVKANNLPLDKFKILLTVNEVKNYFAFNNETSDTVIDMFQIAFDQIAEQRAVLAKKYGLATD